jgi:hypothetical protein
LEKKKNSSPAIKRENSLVNGSKSGSSVDMQSNQILNIIAKRKSINKEEL